MQVSMALTPNSLARRKPGVQIPSPPPPTSQVRASSASSGRRSLHVAAALRPREQVAVQLGRLSATRRLGLRPHTVTTERSCRLQLSYPSDATPDIPDSKPRWLRQMVDPFADTARRPDPDPPPDHVAARRTDELHELTGADTAGRGRRNARTPTRDTGRPHPDIGQSTRGHRIRGHWTVTPDTRHRTPDAWSDRVRGQGDLDTEGIPDRLPGRSRRPDCPLRRRTVDLWSAPSALGDGGVPASADFLPRYQASARSLRRPGQAAPWRIALLRRLRVEVGREAQGQVLWRVLEYAVVGAQQRAGATQMPVGWLSFRMSLQQ